MLLFLINGWPAAIAYLFVHILSQDDYIKGSSDGVWNDNRYFISQPGRGIFVSVAHLRPDTRFGGVNDNTAKPPNRKYVYMRSLIVA